MPLTEHTGPMEDHVAHAVEPVPQSGDYSAQLVTAVFPAGRGPRWWAERHATSPVPGLWPYGLDRLAQEPGVGSVEALEVPEPRRLAQLGLLAGRVRVSRRPGVAFCWDESLAPALLTGVPASRRYCGVIWLTDRLRAGELAAGRERLLRSALRRMDGLWVLSRAQVDPLRDWLGDACPPVHFLPFGVDTGFYAEAPYAARDERPLVVSIGGDRDRDPATLYDALVQVREARPDVRCVVQSSVDIDVPAGIERERFIPHDRVRRLYAQASVVALATRANLHGSGMTVALEAMAVGRPVVASGTPGMADYIDEGRTGHLVPSGDSAALARRLLEVLADQEGAAALGRRAAAHVRSQHSSDAMCHHLARILGGTAPAASGPGPLLA